MIKNERIPVDKPVLQVEGNIVSDMGGEKVMLSIKNGRYYNLGEVGGDIWDLIREPKTVAQLVEILTADYNVEHDECEEQVLSFLELLLQEDLIEFLNC